jgi:hypothetical protein
MYRIEGYLYPHRENWPRCDREFFHVLQTEADEDAQLVPITPIKIWLEESMISYETEWEQKGRKFFVFKKRIDAIRFSLIWL